MNFLLKPLRVIYVIYAAATFLGIMFLILPPIFLASLLGRQKGGNIIFYFLRFWAHTWFPLVGMWVTRKYECERDNDPCIYVVNHRSYLDAAIAVKVMRLPFRPLGKVEMSKIPFFGFIYKNSVVPVDRSNAAARARSVREMMTALKAGISILVFPEGTTNESDQPLRPFHNGAFRMAIELQMPIKPVLYLDAGHRLPHKGPMHISPGKCRVVFLPAIPVKGMTLEDINTLKQQVFDAMDTELRKYHKYPTLADRMKYADVILPLALPRNYTYAVPENMESALKVGSRVAVQLGKQKKYAGIVKTISEQAPPYKTKPLLDMLDAEPVVYPTQLAFWTWVASYYMCTEGEVLNAALPAHLKLSSETLLLFNDAYGDDFTALDDDEYLIAEALHIRKELRIEEVQMILDKSEVYSVIKKLMEKKVLLVYEELKEVYREKKENYVQLHAEYQEEAQLAALFNDMGRAPKQMELLLAYLHLLKTKGSVLQNELLKKSGATTAQLKGLVDKNILWVEKRTVDRIPTGKVDTQIDFDLSPAQETALAEVRTHFKDKQVTLLHGVTSSGKTQVYVKMMEECLATGKQVLYLLPEIGLTAQIIRRLQKHFGSSIGIYHSRFNNNERVEIWNKVKTGEIQIILGARSSLLLPFKDLGLIILDEEHDSSYKQQDPAPRYHARDAAIYYAGLFKAKVLLGSATPSLESYYNAQHGKYGLVELNERFGGVEMPTIEIVDIKKEMAEKTMDGNFTEALKNAIGQSLADGKQVILFQNRRGYAPFLLCTTCGTIPHCKQCDVSLTYHRNQDKLTCHYCGTRYPYVHTCVACGSQTLEPKSFGTEKIEDDLQLIFPEARIARMDVDSIRNKDSHNKLIQLLEERSIDILVGTQMVVKGLDFENVNLVGILSADNLLGFPDFRVNERAFQLMEQVSGRAGRKHGMGKVLIQASNTRHPVLHYVMAHDYKAMYAAEIEERQVFSYPPFFRLLKLTIRHKNQQVAEQAAQILASWLQPHIATPLVGPAAPLVARVRNNYLQEMLIKLPREARMIAHIKQVLQEFIIQLKMEKKFRSVVIVPDVDGV